MTLTYTDFFVLFLLFFFAHILSKSIDTAFASFLWRINRRKTRERDIAIFEEGVKGRQRK